MVARFVSSVNRIYPLSRYGRGLIIEASMANTKYQVNLSVDGKHSVNVQSDDPAALTEALVWAKKTWGQLVRLPGKGLQAIANGDLDRVDQTVPIPTGDGDPPVCTVHHLPMVRVQGKKGGFWSCHQK